MVANFSLYGATWLFDQLGVLIQMAHRNKEMEAQYGHDKLVSGPNGQKAIGQACEAIKTIEQIGENLVGLMKSGHIDNAFQRLGSWAEGDRHRWDDLFIRACAVR